MLLPLAIEAYHGLYRLLFSLYLAHNAVFWFPSTPSPPSGYSTLSQGEKVGDSVSSFPFSVFTFKPTLSS